MLAFLGFRRDSLILLPFNHLSVVSPVSAGGRCCFPGAAVVITSAAFRWPLSLGVDLHCRRRPPLLRSRIFKGFSAILSDSFGILDHFMGSLKMLSEFGGIFQGILLGFFVISRDF